MKAGFRIIDSDLHVQEPVDFLQDYLEEPYRSKTKIYSASPPKVTRFVYELGGKTFSVGTSVAGGKSVGGVGKLEDRRFPLSGHYAEAYGRGFDSADLLSAMDIEGLDIGVVFPTHGFGLMSCVEDLDPDYAAALARAYNTWMRDFCSANPKRLKPTAVVSLLDPVQAAAEARRAVEELGALAIVTSVNIINGHQPHEPFFDPLWAELERVDAPICFHPTTFRPKEGIPPRFRGQSNSDTIAHAVVNPSLNMMNVASFTTGGVFERFPKLRAGFLETNASWLIWLLWRLDDQWEMFGPDENWTLSMKPSEYFRRQGWAAVEPEEEPTELLIKSLGDNLVISTDYPHPDCKFPDAMNEFIELEGLDEDAKQKILWDNCVRLYNLDPETAENRRPLKSSSAGW